VISASLIKPNYVLMEKYFIVDDDNNRVTGRAVVTGKATYTAEHQVAGVTYGVLVGSTIAAGTVAAIDTGAAERAPGVLKVITHQNSYKVPGYDYGANPVKGPTGGKGLQVFNGNTIYFAGQPIALVIGDHYEASEKGLTRGVGVHAGHANFGDHGCC